MSEPSVANPILNSPYDPPERHFELGSQGPTGKILEGRRPSESFIPVPGPRKGRKAEQAQLDFDITGERRLPNPLINDVRMRVDIWRGRGYAGVTPYSRKLLGHWAARPPSREDPMFFCQREAAETAIFLAEVAGRHGTPDFRQRLRPFNETHNEGLPRVGLKMATGTGKTVVMAMLIAWQTINKVHAPRDARFTKRFLVVTPGITIKNRLRVLLPAAEGNYYRERDLVPVDLWGELQPAQIEITNYHTFLLRDAKEIQGVASNTRKLLRGDRKVDPFKETPDQMVTRALRDLGGSGEVVVFNDEAHHCYQDRPLGEGARADAEAKERNAGARVWFRGLQQIHRREGIKAVYDLSATPFYLGGSGYMEGVIFPWVVSDFSLMDAIEAGIVKIPRVPVDDDAKGDLVTYLRLWDHVGPELPKRKTKRADVDSTGPLPAVLEGALLSLYRSYQAAFERYEQELAAHGEPPPVFIVVCPNTVVSKLVYDWIAGAEVDGPAGEPIVRPGKLELLSNAVDGAWTHPQRTILIDSAELESGEAMSADFKKAAAHEIAAFKNEYRLSHPGADVEKITDEDLLREVMNTVGKPGKLGERVRCVVSVSMLTEGWDANTVTHILGIRAFGSQLLCEQVVGRGLRRRSYAANDDGRFEPEYAEVYGVPFAFIPSDRPVPRATPRTPAVLVEALDDRYNLRVVFPKLAGYRPELPDQELYAVFEEASRLHVDKEAVATLTETEGVIGQGESHSLDSIRSARIQQVAYEIAGTLVGKYFTDLEEQPKPWLFPRLVRLTRDWLDQYVTFEPGTPIGALLLSQLKHQAAERLFNAIHHVEGPEGPVLRPIFRRFDPEGSTDDVAFPTRKVVISTTRSHVSHVTLDGVKGNTWEEAMAGLLESHPDVHSYVKNDHLGFTIPYVHSGRSHDYVPDFLVRLRTEPDDFVRTLIIEVSGGLKSPGPRKAKAATARNQWCQAVNNHGAYGVWDYVEVHDMKVAKKLVDASIDELLRRTPIGLPR